MYYDEQGGSASFVTGLLMGLALGAGIALLLAPQEGSTTRRRLVRAVAPGRHRNGDDDFHREVEAAVRAGRRRAAY